VRFCRAWTLSALLPEWGPQLSCLLEQVPSVSISTSGTL
jgi:hypothetical protein